ncbi:MAG: RnfABCDGE type electron transport complex subunit B [Proteobacteria bacterium]|nr:RnfABCDGE type electron transport complex subunit B [Pseudomonadota bacterium]
MGDSLADRLDALLPQTQCTRCSFAGCRPYADALAAGLAGPDQCPPGGDETAAALAALLGLTPRPVARHFGVPGPPRVAVIDEAACIGCAKCLPACPVDAILGARRQMHTVIAAECNGCELCLAPCPVDCIVMQPTHEPALPLATIRALAQRYRGRYQAHLARAARRSAERDRQLRGLDHAEVP